MNVSPDEKLTYFISSKSGFSKKNKLVKVPAFYMTKKSPTKLSVYCISSLTETQVWEIGKKYVEDKIRIKARADFPASIFYENQFFVDKDIKVISTPYPHELHADITPIPIDEVDRSEIFRELAPLCELVMRPEDI